MRIDVFNGSVAFERGTISPSTDQATFLGSRLGEDSRALTINGPYARYGFRPESGVTASAQFHDGQIQSIFVGLDMPDDTVDNWTREHELARKAKHDEWLRRELGKPPYTYRWGSVISDFSERDCESEIVISYKARLSVSCV